MKLLSQSIAPLLVLIVGFYTYVADYDTPQALFWDENYHIVSAEKYLHGVFFMEPHPPLGKLLVAAGEALLDDNAPHPPLLSVNLASEVPAGFSFRGYRLMPVLCAWATALLFYGIIKLIVRNTLAALLLSSLYLFDNALLVHARAAMLDSILLFFVALAWWSILMLTQSRTSTCYVALLSILYGSAVGAAIATKVTGGILVVAGLYGLYHLYSADRKKCVVFIFGSLSAALLSFIIPWLVHFSLLTTINPDLEERGFYGASPTYQDILTKKRSFALSDIPIVVYDTISYMKHYEAGVPALNLCKEDELGSPPFLWPFGGSSINYRWERINELTRYLTLQINPVVWLCGLIGLICAGSFTITSVLIPGGLCLRQRALCIALLTSYAGYMSVMLLLPRVMYLYHYFIPLFFSLLLFALIIDEIGSRYSIKIQRTIVPIFLLITADAVFLAYLYMSPLTYYTPLTQEQFKSRQWLKLWNLRCADCSSQNGYAEPFSKND
jgi:dolichyl-phosphate-mannose-protein mannosyltransferase